MDQCDSKIDFVKYMWVNDLYLWSIDFALLYHCHKLKAELFHNSSMKYRKKISYLGILCKNIHIWYESERNTRIWSSKIFDYTLQPFSDFSVIGWGRGQEWRRNIQGR